MWLLIGYLFFISFILSFLVLQIVKNTKELKEKLNSNLRKDSDLFKNGHLGSDKVRITAF
jgi:hypothetical protein